MMMWRMTEQEMIQRIIVRALRRDVPNGGRGWGSYIARIADEIERGEIDVRKGESPMLGEA
jgi:hypothetical protein